MHGMSWLFNSSNGNFELGAASARPGCGGIRLVFIFAWHELYGFAAFIAGFCQFGQYALVTF